jgi:hypothetical protein
VAPVEDLYAPARPWRTFGMALDMLLLAAGAIVVVAGLVPSAGLPEVQRVVALGLGLALLVVGLLSLRYFVAQGRKAGAVYGIKAARRAGLVSGPDDAPNSPTAGTTGHPPPPLGP